MCVDTNVQVFRIRTRIQLHFILSTVTLVFHELLIITDAIYMMLYEVF